MKKTEDQKPKVFINSLENYINHLSNAQGFSQNTIKAYKDCFAVFFSYADSDLSTPYTDVSFSLLTSSTISSFLDWLEDNRKCSISTRNHRLAILRSFANYASRNNYLAAGKFYSEISKIPIKRAKTKPRSFFTIEETKIILSLPDLHTLAGRRDSVLLIVMYFSAARAQEICDLRVSDIEFLPDGRARIKLHGKGNKTRQIPLPNKMADSLKKYLSYQGISNDSASFVFRSQTHPQMSISCVEAIFKKYIKKAQNEHPDLFTKGSYAPHSMRHTTAVHMLEAGIPIAKIKRFLGHSSIATTEIYAEVSDSALDKAVQDWNKNTWGHLYDYEDESFENITIREIGIGRPQFLL